MEGVGSRLGRASSRYGPSSTTAVFNGPVRKWKRKWVHVSPSPNSTTNTHKNNNNSLSHNTTTNSRLLLCKWTPLPPPTPAAVAADVDEDVDVVGVGPPPPRRRFRYTPVVVIEEEKKATKKVEPDVNATVTKHLTSWQASEQDEMDEDEALKEDTQDPTLLDLGLSLKDNNSDPDKEGQLKKTSSGGFWSVG